MEARRAADPFSVTRVAAALGLGQEPTAVLISVLLTFALTAFVAVVGIPVSAALDTYTFRSGGAAQPDPDRALAALWAFLTDYAHPWGIAPLVASPLFPGLISLGYYWLACIPCAVLDLLDIEWIRKRFKSQADRSAKPGDWRRTLAKQLTHTVVLIIPGLLFQMAVRGPWLYSVRPPCLWRCGGRDLFPAAPPTVMEVAVEVSLALVLFDAAYWRWHSWHHISPLLYRYVHRVHHEYFVPFIWVSQYLHPSELLALTAFSMSVPMALGCHPLTQWIFLCVVVQNSVDAHCGYDFGLLDKVCPFWGGNMHHDNHHKMPKSNFQPFFTWFDYAYGTDFDSLTAKMSATMGPAKSVSSSGTTSRLWGRCRASGAMATAAN